MKIKSDGSKNKGRPQYGHGAGASQSKAVSQTHQKKTANRDQLETVTMEFDVRVGATLKQVLERARQACARWVAMS